MDKVESLRKVSSQRLPPPALFQGPPSHNASNLSLSPPGPPVPSSSGTQAPPLQQHRAPRQRTSLEAPGSLSPFLSRTQSKGEVDRSDAIWQEMQNALSEVELSAVTSEHVFGEKHAEAREDLRMKQLKLAYAWARSEADDEVVDPAGKNAAAAQQRNNSRATGTTAEPAVADDASKSLDEETEKDILLARERREANDRYFDRVNNGVLDVVAKLEEVAQAMRAVERESRDIWSDSDSMSSTTQTSMSAS
ncbi:conserved hypothetical protein [Aspergillus terreus NIH2624]|uniref:Uncharacterized protein n=1 Tax=Aspergillus terreus (strain NIH 2624 / FGSC A1156) TaxID=341663 RepID=Q0CCL8_ASPTN|nr:uncharacterized protein ATEG_08566 [Aspergillus terreus NIH2624]EAU30698.1 conserved hypothetical protein [Aspergillus terreus NIH2624]